MKRRKEVLSIYKVKTPHLRIVSVLILKKERTKSRTVLYGSRRWSNIRRWNVQLPVQSQHRKGSQLINPPNCKIPPRVLVTCLHSWVYWDCVDRWTIGSNSDESGLSTQVSVPRGSDSSIMDNGFKNMVMWQRPYQIIRSEYDR